MNAWQGSPTAGGTFSHASCPADTGLKDQTVRNIVFLSAGGHQLRVRVSNAFGAQPLPRGRGLRRRPEAGARATVPGTLRTVHFSGRRSILIPAGGEALSDPVRLDVQALQRLAVSVYLPRATGPATQHNNSRETNYLAAGNRASSAAGGSFRDEDRLLDVRLRGRRPAGPRRPGDGRGPGRLDHRRRPVHDRRRPALPRPPRAAPPGACTGRRLSVVERRHRRQRAPAQPRPGALRRLRHSPGCRATSSPRPARAR